ncbi:MAG: putative glycoside hydrolase [Ardenticatenaceae bacterium]
MTNHIRWPLALFGVVLFGFLAWYASDSVRSRMGSDLSGELVQLAWFYRPPNTSQQIEGLEPIQQAEALAPLHQHFDRFVLTKNDEETRDQLREEGVEAPFLQYLAFEVILAPHSCTAQPWHNQVADQPGDYCYLSENNPDWFLLDEEGNRIFHDVGHGERAVMMDPSHPGWRAFWLERARQSQEKLGWDGVFLDNVEASFTKRLREGVLPAAYPTKTSYQAAIEGFLAYIYTEYFEPEGRPLYANIIEVEDSEAWFRYLRYLDGAMIESWSMGWSDDYLSFDTWQEHLLRAEQSQAQDKHVILVAQGKQDNKERQQFAYASYLLVSAGKASFRYTHSEHYDEAWLYDNYQLDLGEPLGPRYQDGYATWKRDFTNGSVRVNLASHSATITTGD